MKAITRAVVETGETPLRDRPFLWSTVALCSVGTLVFLWHDFAGLVAWIAL